MERPLHDARLATETTTVQAPMSSSRGAVSLFPSSSTRDRSLSANPGLASFPHEEMESIRAYPLPSNASNLVAGATSATVVTAGFRSVPLPRWSASPLTPRYLTAATHHPPPLGVLLTSSAPGSGSSCAVGNEEGSHFYHYSNGYNAAKSTKATVPESAQKQETELTGTCSNLGRMSNATALESIGANIGSTTMTMSAAMTALPLSVARPLVIPLPPAPVVIAKSVSVAPTRKRKRIPGAMRMRNFLCMHPGCGKSFTDSAHLRDHTVVHTGEKKLSCSICRKLFARASTLQEHIRVHTGEKPYVCGVPGCSKRYSSRAAMRFHRTTHASLSFTAEQSLDGSIHAGISADAVQVQSSQTSSYVCPECGKHFRVRELLMAHLKVHAAYRAAALTSLAPSGLARTVINQPKGIDEDVHRQTDGEESSHSVGISQSDESIYFRDTIRAQQDQIEQLKAEILRLRGQNSVDPAAKMPVQTEVAVSNQPALTAPVEMLQDGFKPFECCICNNRFANFYQLTFHGKQHPEAPMAAVTGEQTPLPVGPKHCPEEQCEYAESTGKSLRNLQTLKRHWQRRHQNKRPYACSYCPASRQKTFKTRENLKAHEKDCTKNVLVQ